MPYDDPVRGNSNPDRYWSTANIGEAAPEVMTPLDWSLWGTGNELGTRTAWHRFGMIGPDEVAVDPDQNGRLAGIFYGHPAMNVDLVRRYFDRFPGITADGFEFSVVGQLRPSTPAFAPLNEVQRAVVEDRVIEVSATHSQRLSRHASDVSSWWQCEVLDASARSDPIGLLNDAFDRFVKSIAVHNETRLLSSVPMSAVYELASKADRADLAMAIFAAFGGLPEMELADDMWALSRGTLGLETFLRRHGDHGDNEGNASGTSWREEPGRLDGLLGRLGEREDHMNPAHRAARAAEIRRAAIAELGLGLEPQRREHLNDALDAAAPSIRGVEIGKAAFLMSIDGFRAAARDLGCRLFDAGELDTPEDVFMLTYEEIAASHSGFDLSLIRHRRKLGAEYKSVQIPRSFVGMPDAVTATVPRAKPGDVIVGIAASAGVHEGPVRVAVGPDDDRGWEQGDVLVCASTDPSWTPLFMLVDGVVIDIGSIASHGAIVARELALPAVIGTTDGSARLKDGDRVRVDGNLGTVTVLSTSPA